MEFHKGENNVEVPCQTLQKDGTGICYTLQPIKSIDATVEDTKIKVTPKKYSTLYYLEGAEDWGESPIQLQEQNSYVVKFENCILKEDSLCSLLTDNIDNIIEINTGNYVGAYTLNVYKNSNEPPIEKIHLEIRSRKSDYENDYRKMLNDIAEECVDIIMSHSSPIVQQYAVDDTFGSSRSAYQRFIFVKSIIDSESFAEAVTQVTQNPVKRWKEATESKLINNTKRLGAKSIRQIVSGTNRVHISSPIAGLSSLPRRIDVASNEDTVDVAENRFVKFALQTFLNFCDSVIDTLKKDMGKDIADANEQVIKEAGLLCDKLNVFLSAPLFREVSNLTILPQNNPTLQKREGYREIYQKWLLFDVAAKLHFGKADEDIYSGGKKNVAKLYEYWLFFKLFRTFEHNFHFEKGIEDLVNFDDKQFCLSLQEGKESAIEGFYDKGTRKLKVKFSFNRTFNGNDDLKKDGSWTIQYRPDYTLSIWPAALDDTTAEEEDVITHIHFDSKYKVDAITSNKEFAEDEECMNAEGNVLIWKKADVHKMHAYKDAIRRTSGAYILYPGDTSMRKKGFHEIIPGLGAFAIKPGQENVDDLTNFIDEVIGVFQNRISQHEIFKNHRYETFKDASNTSVEEPYPEPYGMNRGTVPPLWKSAEASVIIGTYKDDHHLKWIQTQKLYNFRIQGKGAIDMRPEISSAQFLLVYKGKVQHLWKLKSESPAFYSKNDLPKMEGYNPAHDYYLVFKLENDYKNVGEELQNISWNISEIKKQKKYCMSLLELMQYKNK